MLNLLLLVLLVDLRRLLLVLLVLLRLLEIGHRLRLKLLRLRLMLLLLRLRLTGCTCEDLLWRTCSVCTTGGCSIFVRILVVSLTNLHVAVALISNLARLRVSLSLLKSYTFTLVLFSRVLTKRF